ncbi:hypothetical protein AAEX28_05790 [Lentisphaerota bacterium WC36G]|nr:hypothetical protein LJT99_08650 [Lentisphaerae bacterium WC36]
MINNLITFAAQTEAAKALYTVDWQDWVVIGVYFAFMLIIGVVFKNVNKNTSDYFRGGGAMSWWMCGASAFLTTFSAWTFTGAAGEIFKYGSLTMMVFFINAGSALIVGLFFAHKFRRMRCVTGVDAIRKRYGAFNEQVYAWQAFLMNFISGGMFIFTLAVFISPIFDVSVEWCIVITGVIITIMAVTGGSWAVVASDFVQMLVIFVMTIIAAILVIYMPEFGGEGNTAAITERIGTIWDKLPLRQRDWTASTRLPIVFIWIIAMLFNQFINMVNLNAGGAKYLLARSDKDAKKAAYMMMVGFIVGPIIWAIPSMVGSILYTPDQLAAMYPKMENANDSIYAVMCMRVFPVGMVGLMACGIFAAAMSSLDSALNKSSGIFIKNIYQPLFDPGANESKLLLIGKLYTLFLGAWLIVNGIIFAQIKGIGLFDLALMVGGIVNIPMMIPELYGIFIKRVNDWVCWSTALIGMTVAAAGRFLIFPSKTFAKTIGIDFMWFIKMIGLEDVTETETKYIKFIAMIILTVVVTFVWYMGAVISYGIERDPLPHVKKFFDNLSTPVTTTAEKSAANDMMQGKLMGWLCISYGLVLVSFVIITNGSGDICFAAGGLSVILIGFLLYANYLRIKRKFGHLENAVTDADDALENSDV